MFILIINHILQHKALDKYYGETKIKQPSYIIILIAISLGVLYLFNKHFLNPEVILDNNELNNNETYINSQNRKEEYSSIINIAEYHIPKPNDAIFNLNKENGGILQFRNINIEIKIYERNNGFDKYGDDKETGSIQEMFDWDQYSSVRNGYPASIENEIKEEYMIYGYGKKIGDDTKIQARFYAEYPESKHLLYAETWVTDEEQLKDFIYLQNNYLKKYTYDTVIKEKTGIQEYMNQILGEYPSNFLENELVKERLIGLMGNKMYYTICSSFERITPIYKHNNNSKNVTFYVIKGFDEFNEVLILYNPETDNLQVKYTDRNGNNGQIYLENEYEYSPFDENVF